MVFDDKVVISNPGGLPKGLDKKNFGRVSIARNPIIAALLEKSDYIEKMGTGIQRMRLAMLDSKLAEPKFESDGFFIVTLYRNVPQDVPQDIESRIRFEIEKNNKITREELAQKLGVTTKTIQRKINKMSSIEYIGSGYSGYWKIKD